MLQADKSEGKIIYFYSCYINCLQKSFGIRMDLCRYYHFHSFF
uniref:Uncharacterized protein n=1 Tax=Arundo donax TaxID=35708 RepID=A0A0A9E7X0_ARUDO